MIDSITKPQCYRAFYRNHTECTHYCPKAPIVEHNPETPNNIKVGTFLGSAACALAAAFLIARKQSRVLNKKSDYLVLNMTKKLC